MFNDACQLRAASTLSASLLHSQVAASQLRCAPAAARLHEMRRCSPASMRSTVPSRPPAHQRQRHSSSSPCSARYSAHAASYHCWDRRPGEGITRASAVPQRLRTQRCCSQPYFSRQRRRYRCGHLASATSTRTHSPPPLMASRRGERRVVYEVFGTAGRLVGMRASWECGQALGHLAGGRLWTAVGHRCGARHLAVPPAQRFEGSEGPRSPPLHNGLEHTKCRLQDAQLPISAHTLCLHGRRAAGSGRRAGALARFAATHVAYMFMTTATHQPAVPSICCTSALLSIPGYQRKTVSGSSRRGKGGDGRGLQERAGDCGAASLAAAIRSTSRCRDSSTG